MRQWLKWYWEVMLIGAAFVLFTAALVGAVIYDYRHPCTHYASPRQTCQGWSEYCAAYTQDGNCTTWVTQEYDYDCTPCLERRP